MNNEQCSAFVDYRNFHSYFRVFRLRYFAHFIFVLPLKIWIFERIIDNGIESLNAQTVKYCDNRITIQFLTKSLCYMPFNAAHSQRFWVVFFFFFGVGKTFSIGSLDLKMKMKHMFTCEAVRFIVSVEFWTFAVIDVFC